MSSDRFSLTTYRAAAIGVFAALVCVATLVFTIYVPQTRGFFNIGETMIYVTALLFGPAIGGIAGGLGSMIADILLGYTYYAPATLVIKASEGAIVGFLSRRAPKIESRNRWKLYTVLIGIFIGALLSVIGSTYYSGSVELYLGISQDQPTTTIYIPAEVWYIPGALVAAFIALIGFVSDPQLGWTIISVILGGLTMVVGYFLYEQFFLGVFAFAEIPVNIGQMIVGLVVSLPIVRTVRRYFPSLK